MAKVPVPVETIMSDPDLSITSSEFSPGNMIIKRASFTGGETPEHLKGEGFQSGQCQGLEGKTVYQGKRVPKTAACRAGVPESELRN